ASFGPPVGPNPSSTSFATPLVPNSSSTSFGPPVGPNPPSTSFGAPLVPNPPSTSLGAPLVPNPPSTSLGAPLATNTGPASLWHPSASNPANSSSGSPLVPNPASPPSMAGVSLLPGAEAPGSHPSPEPALPRASEGQASMEHQPQLRLDDAPHFLRRPEGASPSSKSTPSPTRAPAPHQPAHRKVLLDPDSGKCYYVEPPRQPQLKTLYD
ncbi:PROB1 protein, partial [Eudromia elegans]|nr:PROB1 protein [Eudromia elegans]